MLASSGLLWLALPPSFLSLSSFTRNKEEIRLWGLSGASVWGPLSFLFHALQREENTVWAALDLLGLSFLYFSYLLWGSGTSPESLLVVWPPLGSSGWLCSPPCCVSFYT